jgi:hypothetical protein
LYLALVLLRKLLQLVLKPALLQLLALPLELELALPLLALLHEQVLLVQKLLHPLFLLLQLHRIFHLHLY